MEDQVVVKKPCCHCFMEIDKRASVCPNCLRHQWWLLSYLYEALGAATLIVSIVAAVYAGLQATEAKQERITADAAVERAEFLATIMKAVSAQREAFDRLET